MRRRAGGQALVLTLAFVAAVVMAWALVFNVGQTVNAKLKLNIAADAAAYSAAVWEARSLNYQAYLNRGIVANEVAIAQLVSLRSWSAYVPWLMLSRATSMPASTSSRIFSGVFTAGPRVHTIFALRTSRP